MCKPDEARFNYVAWLGAAAPLKPGGPFSPGSKIGVSILRRAVPTEQVFYSSRSAAFVGSGGSLISLTPQFKLVIKPAKERSTDDNVAIAFVEQLSKMSAVTNEFTVGLQVDCEMQSARNKDTNQTWVMASLGTIRIEASTGEIAKFMKS